MLLTVRLRDPSNLSRIVLDRSASAKLLFELNFSWYSCVTYLHFDNRMSEADLLVVIIGRKIKFLNKIYIIKFNVRKYERYLDLYAYINEKLFSNLIEYS